MSDKVYEIVTEKILEQLEKGTVPWQKPWKGGNGPRNINGHAYRGVNVLLTLIAAMEGGYESPFWLTFKQAKERGGSVKKGEKSTLITFWKRLVVEDKTTGEKKVVPMLRYFRVFNLEQTEGVKLPKAVTDFKPVEHKPVEEAEAIVAGYVDGPQVREVEGAEAFYVPSTDVLTVPARSQFADVQDFYLTLFHEIGHSTGHESRLNRPIKNTFGSHDYGREELVAEMTAAFLGAEAGVEPTAKNNSASYLASWIRTIKEDPRAVVVAAGAAQRAADRVLGRTFEKDEAKTEKEKVAA